MRATVAIAALLSLVAAAPSAEDLTKREPDSMSVSFIESTGLEKRVEGGVSIFQSFCLYSMSICSMTEDYY
jgi:hypothetical protein